MTQPYFQARVRQTDTQPSINRQLHFPPAIRSFDFRISFKHREHLHGRKVITSDFFIETASKPALTRQMAQLLKGIASGKKYFNELLRFSIQAALQYFF